MIVCIAEKPSVAQDIAQVLGATGKGKKYGYWEGNNYQVTWTYGHLCELKYPEDYQSSWKTWSLSSLPMIPQPFGIRLKQDKGVEQQFQVIAQIMRNAECVINCGDAGQEGELIQRWVMQLVGVKCPVKRLWISSLTPESIREGFGRLKDQREYQSLYEAGLCRAIGDWMLGMNATRLYTLKYGRRERQSTPLSIGRVQTPTLALIVKRQREIDGFVPQDYWVLSTRYRDVLFTATKGKFMSEDEGKEALDSIREELFSVTDVTQKKGKESPPSLFDLTSLQVACNKKFGYSADLTLSLIQSLYEKKITTYPRVDTTYLSDDIYPKCGGILNGLTLYSDLLAPLRGKPLVKSKKFFDTSKVTDHHAIIPTGVAPVGLSQSEMCVFDLVAKHFIGAFYPDCQFLQTTVTGTVRKVAFKVNGKQITNPGWKVIYTNDKINDVSHDGTETREEDKERTLPQFVKGESGPHQPQLSKKTTTPPKPYTEADLLRAMETAGKTATDETVREVLKENGIGRPSTRAAIIETLFKRCYIRKIRTSLYPTATGIQLIDIIHEDLLKSAELTGIWEKKLRDIEHHKYDSASFVTELKQMVSDLVKQVLSDNSNRHVEATPVVEEKKKVPAKRTSKTKKKSSDVTSLLPSDDIVGKTCPLCGKGHILKGRTAYGCSEYRNGCTFRLDFKMVENT